MKVITDRDEFMRYLKHAHEVGALANVDDKSLRDIRIQAADGSKFKITWYNNLCTLIAPGFSLWFDNMRIEETHPCFQVALVLYHNGFKVAHIGRVYDHLVDGYEI